MKAVSSMQRLTLAALFAAIICLTTAFLFHITLPSGGYIHLGDAFVYFAACFLSRPYAAAAAGIGSGLADLLSGAPQWTLFTVVIKAAMTLPFTSAKRSVMCVRNAVASVASGVICIGGYYVAEAIMYGNWLSPLLSLWASLTQSFAAMVLFLFGAWLLDKADAKSRLSHMEKRS